jgi:hypothetical protein
MPVATVFENLEVGSSIQAVLEFAARSRRFPSVPPVCPLRILFDQRVPHWEFQTGH